MHSSNKFECLECNTPYQSRFSYEKHLKESHPSKLCKCDYCEKLFMNASAVTRHVGMFHRNLIGNIKKYRKQSSEPLRQGDKIICRRCLLNCDSEESFAQHIKTHEQDPKPFKCRECGKGFNKRYYLSVHSLVSKLQYYKF